MSFLRSARRPPASREDTQPGMGVVPRQLRSLSPTAVPMVHPQAVELACPPRSADERDPVKQTMKRRKAEHPHGAVENAFPACEGTPRRLEQDPSELTLDPREMFVLSFVDGTLAAAEIADIVGIGRIEVMKILERLARLGCVAFD